MIVLVTGGSGSGKSAWAERLASRCPGENRIYLATMQVMDDESRRRVERHRAQRADRGFHTVERQKDLAGLPLPGDAVVLLEDLVNWTAHEMFGGGEVCRIFPALQALGDRCRHLILVTGNLFSDGEDYAPSVQEYLRQLARVNQQAAEMADCVVEMVYSIPVPLKGALPCL